MARVEDPIQGTIVEYIRVVAPHCRVHAVPNAAPRGKGGRASNAVPGLEKGVPDLCLTIPGGRVAYIEVKAGAGKLRTEQAEWRDWLNANHVPYLLARGIEDVRVFLADIGVDTREAA